jgi:hypothetical protein
MLIFYAMTEDFLHFIWKYGLFERDQMIADTGEKIQVIGLGEHNYDAGPDFLNARLRIGETTWAGNVEIHVRSSDWLNHKHQLDKAFDNVILHVVYTHTKPVLRQSGEVIPTVELCFNSELYENYCLLSASKNELPCKDKISKVDPLVIDLWLNSLVVERLQQKTLYLTELLRQYKNNWEEVFYISLARTFGFGLNAIPFEIMAKSMPLSCLARHRNSLKQLEAMLMGQAGFLEEAILFSEYYTDLRREYLHLKKKYNLKPVEKHLWKFLRIRPVNFPTIRIAQFAALLEKSEGLFSKVLACQEISELRHLFDIRTSDFWDTHYTFETQSLRTIKRFGNDSFNIAVINTVIPFLFLYGKMNGKEPLKDRALEWLNQIPAEKNRVTRRWEESGMNLSSALYSQGFLQLNKRYCNLKRCLACPVGANIITAGTR